jgi:putative endopeptidase
MRLSLLLCAVAVVGFYGSSNLAVAQTGVALAAPAETAWGFDLTGMDRSVAPGDDFYSYANGDWNRRTEIPSDRVAVGALQDLRGYNANLRVRDLLEQEPVRSAGLKDSTQKAVMLYRAFMDAETLRKIGDAPLHAELQRLNQIHSKEELAASMGRSFGGFGSSLFNIDLSTDDKDSKHYAVHLGQGGLGLPSRDYYLEPQFAKTKLAYEAYVGELLNLAGTPDAAGQAHAIVAFETRIAAASWTHAEERDPVKTYNPEDLATLEKSIPDFPWRRFFAGAGLDDVTRVIVTTKTSVPMLAQIFAATPLDTHKAWQAFSVIDSAAPYLPDAYVQARFSFRLHTLGGQPTLAPRWMQAVAFVNEAMGSAVGELYVQKYYPAENQEQMAVLVANLRSALRDRLEHLPWMSASTKAEALRKLANLEVQIGRPKVWIDYTKLAVSRNDLYGDAQREKAFDWQRRVAQRNGLWNKSDWRFWPQYATSYMENNQLIFTAAMLQVPFYNAKADPAINYGGIGSVIGHELTHSFDDQGREFDADNRLRNWWTAEDAAQFKQRADLLSAQYSAMEPLPGLHLKGDVTLGENIADLGGVTIAREAYHESLHGKAAPVLDGFTGDQRFFLGWAQVWREKRRDDDLRQRVTTDVHSPATARVNGVVRNMDSWYDSFDVQRAQKLFLEPDTRVRIW